MKRIALAGGLALALCSQVFAANPTPTPIVPPTETGENSAGSQQVTDMARLKLGMGTVTASGGPTAFTATLNFASGIITTNGMTLVASGAGACPNTITLTNNKIQAGDIVFAILDSTNSAAGAPSVGSVKVSAGQVVILICNDTSTPMTASNVSTYFLVNTQGNPN